MVYFFCFNKNVENYVESVNNSVETCPNLQEFYRVLKKSPDFVFFHNKIVEKFLYNYFYKWYKKDVNYYFL